MKVRLITIVALIVLGLTAVFLCMDRKASVENEYASNVAAARENAEKGIPYMAVRKYQAALKIRCEDEAVYREYVEQARLLGKDYYETAVKNYLELFPDSQTAYEMACEYQYGENNYKGVLNTAITARERNAASEKVRDYYIECYYMYRYINSEMEEAGMFLGDTAVVKREGKYGFLSDNGSFLLAPCYDQASPMMANSAAVLEDGEWHMINAKGFVVAKTSSPVDTLSFISNGLVRISVNGKYSFVPSSLVVPDTLPFDYASNFKNQRAAVKKGEKWAIISSNKEMITDYIFDDVLLDEFDTCINNGVIFAKSDGKYFMLNSNGERISEQGFDAAYPFVTNEPAAVCLNGKWGFVNADGTMAIDPQYENAKSFSMGLAPVCEESSWGYINSSNIYRISRQFYDCLPFSANGIAAVREAEKWSYIKLLSFD